LLQFAWLPFKAQDLNDPMLSRNTPDDLHGIYNYTLNAFPQFKWAFAIEELPNRVILYLDYVIANFHLGGALLALAGAWAMALRHPRVFFLFVPAYLIEVVFFIEYAVQDLDVFFITTHVLFAVLAAFGAFWVLGVALRLASRFMPEPGGASFGRVPWEGYGALAVTGALAVGIAVQPVLSLTGNWDDNDQSANTGINDFYNLVFDELPQNSTIVGQQGVFGYDLFYFRLVYDERPDITLPGVSPGSMRTPQRTSGVNVYSTTGAGGRGFGPGAPFGNPNGATAAGTGTKVVLVAPTVREGGTGSTRQLTLFETTVSTQQATVGSTPQHTVGASFGNVTLVGYDIDPTVEAGRAVRLRLYWRTTGNNTNGTVATKIGDTPYIETHALGFGNAQRTTTSNGTLIVEDYRLVVLSSLDAGEQPIQLRFGNNDWVEAGTLTVTK
jgi:hypothetical protein